MGETMNKSRLKVVAPSQEDREELADAAATQYIKAKHAQGQRVNETAIRRKALKESWVPNHEK